MDSAGISKIKEEATVLVENLNNRGILSNFDVIQRLKKTLPAVIQYNLKSELSQIKDALRNYLSKELEPDGYDPYVQVCALLKRHNSQFTKAENVAFYKLIMERFTREAKRVIDNKDRHLHSVLALGKELAQFYSKQQQFDKADSVLNAMIDALLASDPNMPALRKASLLRNMVVDVRNMGRKNVLERLSKLLQDNAPHIKEEMGEISIPFNIPVDLVESDYNNMMDGLSTDERMMKFAFGFVPRDNQYDSYAKQFMEETESLSLFNFFIFRDDGSLSHKVGPGEENKEEQYQYACSFSLRYLTVSLHLILMKGIEKGLFSVDNVMNFISRATSLSEKRIRIIEKGIRAFLDEDYVSSISILIPQIEFMIRLLYQIHGYTVTDNDKIGTTSDALGTLLEKDDIKIEDINISRYLRLMLSQKTGWNMRNLYCHGITESFGMLHADRVFHIVLLMATLLLPEGEEKTRICDF